MQGRLALREGVLYVGRHEATAHVRPFDWNGRPLADGFSFRGILGDAVHLSGLAVDRDHHVWIADRRWGGVRTFSLFGREAFQFRGHGTQDARGALGTVAALALSEESDEGPEGSACVTVASAGRRRHAVQQFELDGTWRSSLRPRGDPLGHFHDVVHVSHWRNRTLVVEGQPARLQVFRDGEFHFSVGVPGCDGVQLRPTAAAVVDEGALVVAVGGRGGGLLLIDWAGRVLRILAPFGRAEGEVEEPNDVVVEPGSRRDDLRLAVIDRDAERVQVFSVGGRCYGSLPVLPGQLH